MTKSSRWILALGALLLALLHLHGAGLEPANPQTNLSTRAILSYIAGLESHSEKRMLSGQFTDFGDNGTLGILDGIHKQSGHWPALAGFDYVNFAYGGLTTKVSNQSAIAWWRSGGLVTIGVHLYNPANPQKRGQNDKGVELAELLRPGAAIHAKWMQELDELAAGLQELREAGVVVLWRPFHEMNGRWFWWGGKPPADFVMVWRHMFDYFTAVKHLDNLIWVYSPNQGNNAADYYPGYDHVDIVAIDVYTDHIDPAHIKGYQALARLPKPFGFGEYGPHGGHPPGDYDYRRLIAGVERYFPRATFFMSWNAKWSLAENQHVRELLEHSWMVNREDLPRGLAGDGR
jgi:mannan endo-1,4-beta-mannosidase